MLIFLKKAFDSVNSRLTMKVPEAYMIFCAIWVSFVQFKKLENTHGGVLLLVK